MNKCRPFKSESIRANNLHINLNVNDIWKFAYVDNFVRVASPDECVSMYLTKEEFEKTFYAVKE